MARRRPPEKLTFFIDRSLGGKIVAEALRTTGRSVEVHDEHFDADAPDATWIPAVAARRWVVLTKDENISRNPLELEALAYSGSRAFILTTAHATGEALAAIVVAEIERIEKIARRKPNGVVAKFNALGVRIWKTGLRRSRR